MIIKLKLYFEGSDDRTICSAFPEMLEHLYNKTRISFYNQNDYTNDK